MATLPGDVGPALTQPLPGNMGPVPPGEVENNKGLWRGFFDKLKTDNNFRQSVLLTGLGMMRSTKLGENPGDVISESLMSGVNTLDLLRQRDRSQQIEDSERSRKGGLEERGARVGERQAGAAEQVAATGAARAKTEAGDVASRWEQARNELQEAIRHNKAQEEIDRLRARADALRAEAYGSFRKGMPGFQVKAMDAISAQLQQQGWDPVAADAMAAQRVQTTGKATNPADRVRSLFEERVKQYAGSLEALDHPMTSDMQRRWLQEAIELDKSLEGLTTPTPEVPPGPGPGAPQSGPGRAPAGPAAPAAAGPVATAPSPTPAPTGPPNTVLYQQAQAAIARGVPIEQVRQIYVQNGGNPNDF